MGTNIALLYLNINSISGGGGAERQFTDFFSYYHTKDDTKHQLYYILDNGSFQELEKIGLVKSANTLILPGHLTSFLPKKIWYYILWNLYLPYFIFKYNIGLLHLPQPVISLIPSLLFLRLIRKISRPGLSVVLNICNCYFAHDYFRKDNYMYEEYLRRTRLFLKTVKLDGIYSWYQYFVDRSSEMNISGNPLIKAAEYYFVNSGFKPGEKSNVVIYAGRMTIWKNPSLFLESVNQIYEKNKDFILDNKWQFVMYGDGPLATEIDERIVELGLSDIVLRTTSYRLNDAFAASKIFVTTQSTENFTSLSLLEAMAAGNAIIAVNVGETERIVRDNVNGYLASDFEVDEVSEKLFELIKDPEKIELFATENRKVAVEVQNIANFSTDIESFWGKVLLKKRA